jgi:hypothetical protein
MKLERHSVWIIYGDNADTLDIFRKKLMIVF